MNIIDALDSEHVFKPLFRDPDTWSAWRVFLAALFGLEMTEDQRQIFTECTARNEPPTTAAREAWLVIGRRGGKSFTLALIACFLACFFDWRPYLAPGERATIMIIAADRRQARVIMRFIKGILQTVPMLAQTVEAERAEAVELSNSVTLEVHTASFRTVRGYTVCAALLDEVAFWKTDEAGSDPDHEIVSAIKPAMTTVPGAMLLAASSPYARKGVLWESYNRHFGQEGPSLVWQAPTRTMNPTVRQADIDAEYEKDPASAAAEYGAQFRTDIESFVSREVVEACTDRGVHERGYLAGQRYSAFVDPAGGSGTDSMTLAITHAEKGIAVHDVIREVKPPFSPEGVVTEFCDLLKSYKITKIKGDRYAGSWPAEQFQKRGIRYEPSPDPKGAIYVNALPLLNSGKVRLLDNKRLISQLIGLERNTVRGGRDSIDHARGAHDDVANACAGALLAATAKRPMGRVLCWDGSYFEGHDPVRRWPDKPESRIRVVHTNENGEEITPEQARLIRSRSR